MCRYLLLGRSKSRDDPWFSRFRSRWPGRARTVNIREAKTHQSRLPDEAANGQPFIIAEAGKPLVKVTAIDKSRKQPIWRTGFLAGQRLVPDDFDRTGAAEIERLFESRSK